MDFSQQIREQLEGFTPETFKLWNNTSWAHTLLLAAGWGAFGEKPEDAAKGAWIPSKEDRKNAVGILKKALDVVYKAALRDSRPQLEAIGVPPEEIERKLAKATLGGLLASFEAQLKDPESPLSKSVDDYSRETFGFYIAAGKAIAAWEKDGEHPLTADELMAIAPPERKSSLKLATPAETAEEMSKIAKGLKGVINRLPVDDDKPIDFPAGLAEDLELQRKRDEEALKTLGGIDQGVVKDLEKFKQAVFTTKGLSEQGLVCGMLGCKNPPTVPCTLGCGNHYCQECWDEVHSKVSHDAVEIKTKLPREQN